MKNPRTTIVGATILACIVTSAAIGLMMLARKLQSPAISKPDATRSPDNIRPAGATTGIPPIAKRREMSNAERLRLLESNGQVFSDADITEYQLAQKTSWWGKPLNGTNFWRGRAVWLDGNARESAHRHGREWPPMPYHDRRLSRYPNDDGVDWTWSVPEGPNIHFAESSEERAFWNLFEKTHPKPPDDIEAHQYDAARRILGERSRDHEQKSDASSFMGDPGPLELYKKRALDANYPSEAFSADALFWSYVLTERKRYQDLIKRGNSPTGPLAGAIAQDLPLQPELVTGTLTDDQFKAANAWKVAYLQRLRREKTDDSYINAYLKAWNLSDSDVFGPPNQ